MAGLDLHAKLLRVWNTISGDTLPANVKCAIELQGRVEGRDLGGSSGGNPGGIARRGFGSPGSSVEKPSATHAGCKASRDVHRTWS